MVKKLLIVLLFFIFCYGTIVLTQDDSRLPVVEVDNSEITINDSSDVEEYVLGLKP